MRKVIAAIAAITFFSQGAIAGGIKYQNNYVYRTIQNGRKYVILLGQPNSQITMSWQPETIIPGKVPARKSRTYTLNECGFKNIVVNLRFPLCFKNSLGAVALEEEYGFATEYLSEAPALPVCRSVSGQKVPYIIQGWEP